MHSKQLEAAETARTFILAGHAIVTLVSAKTGTRFTYRVSRPDETKPHFVSLLSGPQNTSDYTFLGTIFPAPEGQAQAFRHGKRSTIGVDAPSAKAFAWAWAQIAAGRMPGSLEVWHEGRCGKCGRALTVPESIESGIGPVCEQKAGG